MRCAYDAFGNEKNKAASDANPFRCCEEYFDKESGWYHLRARYCDPSIGRLSQEDAHWGSDNAIYGDEPQQTGPPPTPNPMPTSWRTTVHLGFGRIVE